MRHAGGAEDADREQDAVGAVEAGHEEAVADAGPRRVGLQHLESERDHDDADEGGDHRLEPAEPPRLEGEDPEGRDAGEDGGREEREAGEQVDADRGADELRDVGRHRDHLGLDPEQEGDPAWEARAAHLRQVQAGRDPELRAHRLDQHRHQVRREHDPEEEVAELRAGRHVGREVAGVDVRDRGDEGGAEEGRQAPQTAPLAPQRALRGTEDGGLARERILDPGDERFGGGQLSGGGPPGGRRSVVSVFTPPC